MPGGPEVVLLRRTRDDLDAAAAAHGYQWHLKEQSPFFTQIQDGGARHGESGASGPSEWASGGERGEGIHWAGQYSVLLHSRGQMKANNVG